MNVLGLMMVYLGLCVCFGINQNNFELYELFSNDVVMDIFHFEESISLSWD